MDPITVAILAAIGSLSALHGVSDSGMDAVQDGYNRLKALIKLRYGEDSKIAWTVEETEQDKDSPGQAQILAGTIAKSGVDQDPEILEVARELQRKLRAQPGGRQYIQNVRGNLNAVVQDGGTATVYNYASPPPESSKPS